MRDATNAHSQERRWTNLLLEGLHIKVPLRDTLLVLRRAFAVQLVGHVALGAGHTIAHVLDARLHFGQAMQQTLAQVVPVLWKVLEEAVLQQLPRRRPQLFVLLQAARDNVVQVARERLFVFASVRVQRRGRILQQAALVL